MPERCQRCSSLTVLKDTTPPTEETAAVDELLCLACGWRGPDPTAEPKRRYLVEALPPLHKRGRPATGASVRHPDSRLTLKLREQGLIP